MRREAEDKRRRAEDAARRAREESERLKREEEERRRAEEEAARMRAAGEGPIMPKATTEENRRTAQQHYLEGLKFYQNSNFEKARDEWNIAKQLDPGNADVESGLKRIDKLLGDSQ